MKIIVISPDVFPFTAGYGGRNPFDIARRLSQLGHDVVLLSSVPKSFNNDLSLSMEGKLSFYLYKLLFSGNHYLNYYFPLKPLEMMKLHKIVKILSRTSDLFVLNGSLESLSFAFLLSLPRYLRGRVVFINHGLPNPNGTFIGKISFILHSVLGKIVFSGIRYVISYSRQSEELLKKTLSSPNTTNFYLTNLGIDCDDFLAKVDSVKDKNYELSNKIFGEFHITGEYVYAVGRFERNKGYDELLEAFITISEENQNVQLVISGELTSYTNFLRNKYLYLLNEERVIFTGRVDDDTKIFLMLNCRLYVISSIREGFGGGAIEASILGINTLATRTGNMETVLRNLNPIIIEPGSVSTLLSGLRKGLTRKINNKDVNKETCRSFSIEKTVETIIDIHKQIL